MESVNPTAVSTTKPRRLDLLVLWGGIVFSLAFSALVWWAGQRWIPFIEYLGVMILAGIFGAGLWMAGRIKGKRSPASRQPVCRQKEVRS